VPTIRLPQSVKTARVMPSISHHASLCVDSGVPNDGLPSRSQQWANDARSIAYVEHDAAQRRLLVENCRYGVLQRKCLPGDGTEMEELPCFDGVRWAIG
jgi:hypothetical protein